MSNFDEIYGKYVAEFNAYADDYATRLKTNPSVLAESMRYSLLNGGKRIRPVLALACAELLGVPKESVLPFALAIEMIHTYSLIHDDLPAMDDDDFRRGKPSSHKKFGEANAILAGDGLLNEAYAVCLSVCANGEEYLRSAQYLNECAGVYGMIAGQSADLYFSEETREISEKDLRYIYEHKTGKLLLAPVVIPSVLSGNKHYISLQSFGKRLGELFQMTDDILDVVGDSQTLGKTTGKDDKENKLTCVRLYGLEASKIRAEMCARDCLSILESVNGDTEFLSDLVNFVLTRIQ